VIEDQIKSISTHHIASFVTITSIATSHCLIPF